MAIHSSGRRGTSTSSSITAADRGNHPALPTVENGEYDRSAPPLITWRVFAMGILVSMGGLIFGNSISCSNKTSSLRKGLMERQVTILAKYVPPDFLKASQC